MRAELLATTTTTTMLDSFEVVYSCPTCGRVIRRYDAFNPLRLVQAIVQHAHEHQRDADAWQMISGEPAP